MPCVSFLIALPCPAQDATTTLAASKIDPVSAAGLTGGLIVQLGGANTSSAEALSRTGRYLVHVLDPDPAMTTAAQDRIRAHGHYGLAWAEHARDTQQLPYTENVVNLVVVNDYCVPAKEILRVLTPGGAVVVLDERVIDRSEFALKGFDPVDELASAFMVRKRWPDQMDVWSHPRHGADGNAVSMDTIVGPPERVRWVAAATSEVEGLVTDGRPKLLRRHFSARQFQRLAVVASRSDQSGRK